MFDERDTDTMAVRTVPWSSDIRKRLLVQGIEDVRCVNLEVIVNVRKEVT